VGAAGDVVQGVARIHDGLVRGPDPGSRAGGHPGGRDGLDRVHVTQARPRAFLEVGLEQEGQFAAALGPLDVQRLQFGQPLAGRGPPVFQGAEPQGVGEVGGRRPRAGRTRARGPPSGRSWPPGGLPPWCAPRDRGGCRSPRSGTRSGRPSRRCRPARRAAGARRGSLAGEQLAPARSRPRRPGRPPAPRPAGRASQRSVFRTPPGAVGGERRQDRPVGLRNGPRGADVTTAQPPDPVPAPLRSGPLSLTATARPEPRSPVRTRTNRFPPGPPKPSRPQYAQSELP